MGSIISKGRPSPATLISVIALVFALTGAAAALPGKNSVDKNDIRKNAVKSKQVKKASLKLSDLSRNAKPYWVRVDGDNGNEYQASPGVSAERLDEGLYFVRFPESIRERVLLASLGSQGTGNLGNAAVRATRCGSGSGEGSGCSPASNDNPRTVFVETDNDADNASEDVDFEIAAIP